MKFDHWSKQPNSFGFAPKKERRAIVMMCRYCPVALLAFSTSQAEQNRVAIGILRDDASYGIYSQTIGTPTEHE